MKKAWLGVIWLRIKIRLLSDSQPLKIIVGAGGIRIPGWITTEEAHLDITSYKDWKTLFQEHSIDAILAEHVWEHLTPEQISKTVALCAIFLKKGGRLRIAVPDGYHPSKEYIELVQPGGSGGGADDHELLYNYQTLSKFFSPTDFKVNLLEYFDEKGTFHAIPWNVEDGIIRRCAKSDPRNQSKPLVYTSLILDAIKLT